MYLKWNTKTITDLTDHKINTLYNEGYLFARTSRGEMYQTRSLRIDLTKFALSSENKRILKKTEDIQVQVEILPYSNYHWSIHKLGKDFYTTKFALNQSLRSGSRPDSVFSANKIKELMTDPTKSNFNIVFVYTNQSEPNGAKATNPLGYCIALKTNQLIHYCYPFYDLGNSPKDIGLCMMLKAILYAQDNGKKYIYLGSASRPTDSYKLQFKGLEWYDGKEWKKNLDELKQNIKNKYVRSFRATR